MFGEWARILLKISRNLSAVWLDSTQRTQYLKPVEIGMQSAAADSLEVSVDCLQIVLEFGYKLLLSPLQSLPVLHAILQGLEDAAHARPERLDAADGVRKRVQVHPDVHHIRHLVCLFLSAAAGAQ